MSEAIVTALGAAVSRRPRPLAVKSVVLRSSENVKIRVKVEYDHIV